MAYPKKSPWAAIDVLPAALLSSLGVSGIAEMTDERGPFVRVFCQNVSLAVERLPGSFNGFPVEISESGKIVPADQLEGLKQIRHYNVMADIPQNSFQAPAPSQHTGQATDIAQTITQPITDTITGGYDAGKSAYDSIAATASSASATASAATSVTDAMQSAYQSQAKAAADYLAQQRAIAAQSASAAGQQASGSASSLGAIVLVSAIAIIAVMLWKK